MPLAAFPPLTARAAPASSSPLRKTDCTRISGLHTKSVWARRARRSVTGSVSLRSTTQLHLSHIYSTITQSQWHFDSTRTRKLQSISKKVTIRTRTQYTRTSINRGYRIALIALMLVYTRPCRGQNSSRPLERLVTRVTAGRAPS